MSIETRQNLQTLLAEALSELRSLGQENVRDSVNIEYLREQRLARLEGRNSLGRPDPFYGSQDMEGLESIEQLQGFKDEYTRAIEVILSSSEYSE